MTHQPINPRLESWNGTALRRERGMADEGLSEVNKAGRLPRWSRQELVVLIQGKRVAEKRGGECLEPKWSSVSSYCKRHGVNRGPVQCRKRWSNLAGDFKKIKQWESNHSSDDSFWVIRNDLRRQRKLPGFFDRELYDILDTPSPLSLDNLILSLAPSEHHVFDSNNNNHAALFSDIPISATQPPPPPPPAAAADDKEPSPSPESYQRKKRKRRPTPEPEQQEEETSLSLSSSSSSSSSSLQKQLIEAMERNGRLLTSQLEIQNTNSHLDREQRKDHANTLFALLNKLADAMVRIADKL